MNNQQYGQAPVLVLNATTKRETGREAQISNIRAAKGVGDIVRTCLGPKSMLKMILSQSGSTVLTNDGHAILREVNVAHPAAKAMIELSRSQDEEVGDGTTSVIILASEMLSVAEPFLERKMHPRLIIQGYTHALKDALEYIDTISKDVDVNNDEEMKDIISSCIGTKFISRYNDLMCQISLDAIRTITIEEDGRKEVDLRRYIRIERIPGEEISDSVVIPGVVVNKDVVHAMMRRRIENPRIILLDCNLEGKKSEGGGTAEVSTAEEWEELMKEEEDELRTLCNNIIKLQPDLVITSKGISDEAQQIFVDNNITALRRFKTTMMTRIARAVGATTVNRPEELKESDVGTRCGLFKIEKIGDEYYTYITDCADATACTILLRGASKEVLSEVERNLQDALSVAKNIIFDPRLCPGGGALEMAVASHLMEKSKSVEGVEQWPYHAVGLALEVIPRTLIQNCGVNMVRTITNLRAQHSGDQNPTIGINGDTGEIVDMVEYGVWEPISVKTQTLKTAVECACMLLRIDDIVSGMKGKKKEAEGGPQGGPPMGA
eukprot:TRINITY_DN60_c0_g1_i1.p1 TRINITY_DN60_c0_g1~~TRINITY_DN60_c0_g1_i1.p1  ORF type:complete len:550 (-),score=160.90 TRINITY_DN60_c0_g1_i1:34-1683(-)